MSRLLSAFAPLLLAACAEPPTISGTVTDIYGTPVEGAQVMMQGVTEHEMTDAAGQFTMAMRQEPMQLMAGKDGFIRGLATVEPPADAKASAAPASIKLYPEPKTQGFYVITDKAYQGISGEPIDVRGNELAAITGVKETGPKVPKSKQEFLFSSTLRKHELSRLNLQLHRLEFVEKSEAKGVLGPEPVDLHLWVAQDKAQFDLTALHTDNVFTIAPRKPLAAGVYAFHTQGALTAKSQDALDKLPKELRVAYVFEIK